MQAYGKKVTTIEDSHREKVAAKRKARQAGKQEIRQQLREFNAQPHLDSLDQDEQFSADEYYDYHDPDRYEGDTLEWEDHDQAYEEFCGEQSQLEEAS